MLENTCCAVLITVGPEHAREDRRFPCKVTSVSKSSVRILVYDAHNDCYFRMPALPQQLDELSHDELNTLPAGLRRH